MLTSTPEKFCDQGWNGQCVCVSLAVLEKPGVLKTLEGPRKTCGSTIETRISPKGSYPGPSAALNSIQACPERYVVILHGKKSVY